MAENIRKQGKDRKEMVHGLQRKFVKQYDLKRFMNINQ